MTIPVIRKRAKKPKVRTGCKTCRARHIKCDEERPGCRRCRISGRECGGYDAVLAKNGESPAVILPKESVKLYAIAKRPAAILSDMTGHEVFAFDHFRLETVRQLPGSSWTLSWERLALQMGHHDPAVTHAAVALGSIHRALKESGDVAEVQHEFALTQYNKAMGYVRKHIEKLEGECLDEDVEVVLLVSLLFFCFEVMHSEDIRAKMHLHTGLRILYERLRRNHSPGLVQERHGRRREVITPTTPKNNMDILVQTFVRLDGDLTIVGEDEPYLSPICREPLPTSFHSLEQAMVHLDAIGSRIHDLCREFVLLADKHIVQQRPDYDFLDDGFKSCLACAYSRVINIDDRPDLTRRLDGVKTDLNIWMAALANVSTTTQQRSAQLLAQIHFFYVWLLVTTWRDKDEVAVDRLDAQFDHIIRQAEEYVDLHWSVSAPEHTRESIRLKNASTRQAFTLGTDLVPCIAMISFKSRSTSIRRRCVELIRTINLQGVFDNYYLAAFIEQIWYTEEALAREITGKPEWEDFECHEIPNEARMVELELSPMQFKHDFYKADAGRLIFILPDENGDLQPHDKMFEVDRPLGQRMFRKGETRYDSPLRVSIDRPIRQSISALDRFNGPSYSGSPASMSSCSTDESRPRRMRGHMPCCCHHPHEEETSELLKALHIDPQKPKGFFANYFGWKNKDDDIRSLMTSTVDLDMERGLDDVIPYEGRLSVAS